jgi:3-hydroxyacyl-[acyl-carrier-protein] dehydratase
VKYLLVDRISELEPGRRIVAHKALSLAEEYLADHFPAFPVLPGVLMLEAMVQASAWLVHATRDFADSVVVLKEARNVTYKSFVAPGHVLTIESTCKELGEQRSVFSAHGHADGREMVKAAITLRHLNLAAADSALGEVDANIRSLLRRRFELLTRQSKSESLA